MDRKRDGPQANQPAVQVVGFAWRGGTPSPDPASGSILQGEDGAQIAASPVPVIIPPQFQVHKGAGKRLGAAHCAPDARNRQHDRVMRALRARVRCLRASPPLRLHLGARHVH